MKRIFYGLIFLTILSCSKEEESQEMPPYVNNSGKIEHHYGSIYNGGFNDFISIIKVLSDDKSLIVGNFTKYKDKTINRIVRLNKDGSIDETFNSGTGFDNYPLCVAVQPDGKYIITGKFNKYNGVTANNIIRLNTDGTIDSSFNTGDGFYDSYNDDKWFGSITLDNNGKILVGGRFFKYNNQQCEHVIRLNSNGTLDNNFIPYYTFGFIPYTSVVDIEVDTDDSIYLSYVGNSGASKFLKMNNDGSRISSFNNATINSLGWGRIRLWDNKIYYFDMRDRKVFIFSKIGQLVVSTINGGEDFAFQSDGKILIGSNVCSTYILIRLNQDLSVDNKFNVNGTGFERGIGYTSSIADIAVQSDDNILVGGRFKIYNTDGGSANLIRLYK